MLKFHEEELDKAINAINKACGVEGKTMTVKTGMLVAEDVSGLPPQTSSWMAAPRLVWDTKEDWVWEATNGQRLAFKKS